MRLGFELERNRHHEYRNGPELQPDGDDKPAGNKGGKLKTIAFSILVLALGFLVFLWRETYLEDEEVQTQEALACGDLITQLYAEQRQAEASGPGPLMQCLANGNCADILTNSGIQNAQHQRFCMVLLQGHHSIK